MSLEDPSYFLSIVETITHSLRERSCISIHDLLDAYATFTNRVRCHSQPLDACDTLLPALTPFRVHKDDFIRALRRDIQLAHIDPLLTTPPCLAVSIHINIEIDTKQHAWDSSSLCHHALCALAIVFRFPAFHLVFPEHDLSTLFSDVLHITLAEQLPILNEAKTYSLSLWTLSSHRLPATILDSRRDDIISALQQSLDGARQPDGVLLDGLKAISHTLESYPSGFLYLLFPLLPRVIACLDCESSELHLHVSIVLAKFANALVHQTELSLTQWRMLSNHIISYLESCCDESQVVSRDRGFLRVVRAAFSVESHACPRVAPTWILSVLASLIVLCGPALYSKPTVLDFILRALAVALTHKRSIIRALHPHVWRCFIWSFSRMLFASEDVEPGLISLAFYVIKQEVSGGIGTALTSVLLSDQVTVTRSAERGDRVSKALLVIKAMVQAECKHTRREGFAFLQAFTNVSQVRNQILQNMDEIPASALLNGTIISAKWNSLPSVIHSIPKVPVSMHWLAETEIARHYKTLLVIWCIAAQVDRGELEVSQLTAFLARLLSFCAPLKPGLVDVWLSILLACSHQLDCEQHVVAITDALRYTATIIVDFLPSVALEGCQPNWRPWDLHDQLSRLTFIGQLWSAMRRAFVGFSLAEAAELILLSILKYAFHVLDHGVRGSWSGLCADLMITVSPSFLRDLHDRTEPRLVIQNQRELWGVVAMSLSPQKPGLDWKELVGFLAIPICTWVLSKSELETWEELFQSAITSSEDSASVIEHFTLQHLRGKEVETWESAITVLDYLLVCAHARRNSLSYDLLSIIDSCLIASYSRAGHSPETLAHSLELLNVIRHMIISAPREVMHLLQPLCRSLCLWIEDPAELMSNNEFNSVAVSLYCDVLEALKVLPPSIQSLQDTENFLASAFSRIPTPAIAPFAFEKFWRATYHGQCPFYNALPPKIKFCLTCFVTAYGGDLADGLPLAIGSQSQNIKDDSFASPVINTGGPSLGGDSFQLYSPTGHQYQDSGELSLRVNPSLTTSNPGIRTEALDMDAVSHEPQQMSTGEDTTFTSPSSCDDVLQLTVLRQLQEYSTRIDAPSHDGLGRSTDNPQTYLLPTFPPCDVTPSSHFPEKDRSVVYAPHPKRDLVSNDSRPHKRSRTLRDTLRSVRNLESEPASREITPINVPRMNSVPSKKRRVFDGVEVPTFREVSRRKLVQRVETGRTTLRTSQGFVSSPQTPSHDVQKRRTPPFISAGSDEDDLDWEDYRIDATSSEVDVDQSLKDVHPSLSPQFSSSAAHERDDESCLRSGLGVQKVLSQSEGSSSAPARPSLRRAETTSARLDALRDVYASVANGGSQIPTSELVQATKLVHQIGAVLTEQMGKKMDDPG